MKKLTKKSFIDATRGTANKMIAYNGLNIRLRLWDNNSWQIVDSNDFDTANIIKEFRLRDELWEYIKNNQ